MLEYQLLTEWPQWLLQLGCSAALNYKSPTFAKDFKEATKDLIDVFFDNVGGEQLDLALSRAKAHARFVMCGAISQYNSSAPVGPKVRSTHFPASSSTVSFSH
jgi:NADPH-dependent curcumin reductase CurA